MVTIKEKYANLKKKYSLPEYDDLNRDFGIEEINNESEIILQKIRLAISEKLDIYAKQIESRLQPDSSLADMYEAHYIYDDEKNNAYLLFKRIMKILRYSTLVSVYNKEDENAKFIKDAYAEWTLMREDIKSHNSRLLKLWEKETDIKEDLNYLG